MDVLLTVALYLGIILLFVLVTGVIALFSSFLRTRVQKEDMELLDRIANMAVWAVEQMGAGVFGGKKATAAGIVATHLKTIKKDGRFSPEIIEAAIESNVGTNFHWKDHASGLEVVE